MLLSPWKIFFFILASLFSVGLFSLALEKAAGNADDFCISVGSLQPCMKFFTIGEMAGYKAYVETNAANAEQERLLAIEKAEKEMLLKEMNSLEDSIKVLSALADYDSARFWLPDNNREFWFAIFSQWDQLKSKKELYRIIHHGDSQIEMDRITAILRRKLQKKYGGSGPGFLPPWQLIPSYTVSQTTSENWRRYIAYGVEQDRNTHNHYGAAGMIFKFDSGYAHIGISSRVKNDSLISRFETIKILTGRSSRPVNVSVSAKNNQFSGVLEPSEQEQMIKWDLDGRPGNISINFSGDSSSGIIGVAIDGKFGIAMDNVPWRGSSGMTFTSISKSSLANTYKLLDVKMVILQFGGNSVPYIKSEEAILQFGKGFKRQIEHIKSANPAIKIIVIGPGDMSYNNKGAMETYPFMEKIIAEMRRVSVESGAAFWSMYHAMGGKNSMVRWVEAVPQLSTPDYIHFTQKGSEVVADKFYKAIENEHIIYFKKRELDARNSEKK